MDKLVRGLEEDFEGTAEAILTQMVARQMSLQVGVTDYIMSNPDAMVQGGRVSDLISKDLLKLQRETRQTLALLKDITGGKQLKSGEKEVKSYGELVNQLSRGTV